MRRLPLRLIVIVLLVPLVAAASLGTVAFQVYRQETRRLVSERDERAVRAGLQSSDGAPHAVRPAV